MLTIWKMYTRLEKYTEPGKDDYYTRNAGTWHGKGAERQGLAGAVEKEDFQACRAGVNPQSGEQLVPPASNGNHKDGYDLTFSSPKGISMLKELGDDKDRELIERARAKATERTMEHIQENYIYVRETHNGNTELVRTGSAVWAQFDHQTSREGDMQDHTHCALMNESYNPNTGKWQAIEGNVLMQNEHYLGQYWRNEYAAELSRAYKEDKGISLPLQTDAKGLFDVDRSIFTEEEKEYFSKRSAQIAEKAEELRGEYQNASEGRLKEVANLSTRAEKDEDLNIKEKRAEWRAEASEKFGITPESIQDRLQQASERVQQAAQERSEPRMNEYEYVRLAARDLTENESVFNRENLLRTAGKYSVGEFKVEDLDRAAKELEADKELKVLSYQMDERKGVWREYMTTQEMKDIEKDIIRQVRDGQGKAEAITTLEKAQESLRKYEDAKRRVTPDFRLTEDQEKAREHILTSPDRVCGIQGDAGTGKTTMLDAVREQAESEGYRVRGFAKTGPAAAELEEDSGIKSQTVDSFLMHEQKNDSVEPFRMNERDRYRDKEKNQLDVLQTRFPGKQLWIIDEASLLGSRQMKEMIDRAKRANAKLVPVGDTKQIPSVDAGGPFQKLQETGAMRTVEMHEVTRQSGWYKEISESLAAKRVDYTIDRLEKNGKLHEIGDRKERIEAMVRDYMGRDDYRKVKILTSRNADRHELNIRIRHQLKEEGVVKDKEFTFTVRESKNVTPTDKHFAQSYEVGDLVYSNKAGVMEREGQEGRVTDVDHKNHKIRVQVKDGELVVDLKKKGEGLSVFREKEQNFSVGDRVVMLKNDKGLKLKNGPTGTIMDIDANGKIVIRLDKGGEITFNVKSQYNYLDHGYAITDMKSQSGTISKGDVIYHGDTQKQVDHNRAYVSITRGQRDMSVYTNSVHDRFDDNGRLSAKGLAEQMKISQIKRWTGDFSEEAANLSKDFREGADEVSRLSERKTKDYIDVNEPSSERAIRHLYARDQALALYKKTGNPDYNDIAENHRRWFLQEVKKAESQLDNNQTLAENKKISRSSEDDVISRERRRSHNHLHER